MVRAPLIALVAEAKRPAALLAPRLDILARAARSAMFRFAGGLRVLELELRVHQLKESLAACTVTAQATGILMSRNSCSADQAAALLRKAAGHRGTTVETEAAILVNRTARLAVTPVRRLRDVPPREGHHAAGVFPRLRGH